MLYYNQQQCSGFERRVQLVQTIASFKKIYNLRRARHKSSTRNADAENIKKRSSQQKYVFEEKQYFLLFLDVIVLFQIAFKVLEFRWYREQTNRCDRNKHLRKLCNELVVGFVIFSNTDHTS